MKTLKKLLRRILEKIYKVDNSKQLLINFNKREWNYFFNEGDLVMFANDIPLNYNIVNIHDDSFLEEINLDDYNGRVGEVKRCWSDLESFASGSAYLCDVDFNGKIITNGTQLFVKITNFDI